MRGAGESQSTLEPTPPWAAFPQPRRARQATPFCSIFQEPILFTCHSSRSPLVKYGAFGIQITLFMRFLKRLFPLVFSSFGFPFRIVPIKVEVDQKVGDLRRKQREQCRNSWLKEAPCVRGRSSAPTTKPQPSVGRWRGGLPGPGPAQVTRDCLSLATPSHPCREPSQSQGEIELYLPEGL